MQKLLGVEKLSKAAACAGYVISDGAFDPSLKEDPDIALAAVSYDGCALKHVAAQLRFLAGRMKGLLSLQNGTFCSSSR